MIMVGQHTENKQLAVLGAERFRQGTLLGML